ncbi:YafY family protein [Actinoplanes sp. NPDC049118]|uniref:helix-turn-helix transcriptional regulator n=1 Tax=Actinoplanes sp. NPDC049118 TaxID=3155769 RepID=UPI0033DE2549
MPHPASRVLAMLELLQAHRRMTGGDLAARLAVDERTVRRYAGTLAELGIPVTSERGRYGGYRLLPGFKLPPLMLTDDEAVAVMLGLMAADRIGLAAGSPANAAAEAKITRVLPAALAERLAALRASLGLTIRGPAPREPDAPPGAGAPGTDGGPTIADLLLTLGAATRGTQRLDLTYRAGRRPVPAAEPGGDRRGGDGPLGGRSRGDGPYGEGPGGAGPGEAPGADERRLPVTRRVVDPYGLVFHGGRWYLVAHDHRSDEVRSFRLDRIVTVRPTGAGFEAPPNFDAVAHVTRQWAGLPWRWEVEVLIDADVAQVRRRIPAALADLTEAAEGVRLSCRVQSLPGMAQMLAGLGWPFTVVRPDELRTAIVEHAAQLVRCAER